MPSLATSRRRSPNVLSTAIALSLLATHMKAIRASAIDRGFLRAHFQAHFLQRKWLPTAAASLLQQHDLDHRTAAVHSGGSGGDALVIDAIANAAANATVKAAAAAATAAGAPSTSLRSQAEDAIISTNHETTEKKKILFVTAIYGDYEKTLKEPVPQTHPADFVAFTNRPDLSSPTWQIRLVEDPLDYLIKHGGTVGVGVRGASGAAEGEKKSHQHDGDAALHSASAVLKAKAVDGINSLANNRHPFNEAKVFKMQFYRFFDMSQYRAAVWLDATLRIIGPETAGVVFRLVAAEDRNLVTFEHNRRGLLSEEAVASKMEKYEGTHWGCCDQPFQNVTRQYEEYVAEGFSEKWWLDEYDAPMGISKRPEWGLWVTSFVAFDLHSPKCFEFLDAWWRENVVHTTQDQVSFPYLAWKLKVYPFSLPSLGASGGSWMYNDFFARSEHGMRKSL